MSGRGAGGAVWISSMDAPAPPHWYQMLPPRLRKTLVLKPPAMGGVEIFDFGGFPRIPLSAGNAAFSLINFVNK